MPDHNAQNMTGRCAITLKNTSGPAAIRDLKYRWMNLYHGSAESDVSWHRSATAQQLQNREILESGSTIDVDALQYTNTCYLDIQEHTF